MFRKAGAAIANLADRAHTAQMKTVQIIDGADNATFSLFRATDEEFRCLFPGEGQDLELVEDFFARHHADFAPKLLAELWGRPVHKSQAGGIDGTLFYDYGRKRHHLPASKREIDRDPSQLNPATRALYEQMQAEPTGEGYTPPPTTTADLLKEVEGGQALLDWFEGRAPNFHDGAVLGVALDSNSWVASLRAYGFTMTEETDPRGYFILKDHVVAGFHLAGVTTFELEDSVGSSVIYALSLSRTSSGGYRLDIEPTMGLAGFIEAESLSITLEPGKPV